MDRLVALGCSLTLDNFQKTWPDYLAEHLNLQCDNLGARGAGMDFIKNRLLSYRLISSDIVIIMLPSADRFDWYIDQGNPLQQNALNIASWQNGKHGDFVQLDGSLSDSSGFVLSGGEHRGEKRTWYKYFYSEYKASLDFWNSVYFLELYLKNKNIKYRFTSAYDKNQLIEQPINCGTDQDVTSIPAIRKIDFRNFIYYKNDKGFLSFTSEHKFEFVDHYPVTNAHKKFAEYMATYC